MTPDERSEFTGQGEGHHEVFHRQQFGLLPIQPLTGFMVLALGTATVPAGQRMPELPLAFGAMQQHLTGIGRAATLYCADGSVVAG
jgi:hypothetical protein